MDGSLAGSSGFLLDKWYLDCVGDDGSVFIGYWARLRWRGLGFDYAGALIAPADSPPLAFASLRSSPAPASDDGQYVWRCEPLGIRGRWTRDSEPITRVLLHTAGGGIRWLCHQPRGVASILFGPAERADNPGGPPWRSSGPPPALRAGRHRLGRESQPELPSRQLTGLGYVEELQMSIPPWRLPFNVLRWGRFLSPAHTVVWLGWEKRANGPEAYRSRAGAPGGAPAGNGHGAADPLHLAFLDGLESDLLIGEATAPPTPGRTPELRLGGQRVLRDGYLLETVFSGIPALARRMPAGFLGAHESKRVGSAELHIAGAERDTGWAIHEVVSW